MRVILLFATAMSLASCSTINMPAMNAGLDVKSDEPRTPDVFRRPAPQTGRWGSGVGYGTRY